MTVLRSAFIRTSTAHATVYAHSDSTVALDVMRYQDDGSNFGSRWVLLPDQAREIGEALIKAAAVFDERAA